MKIKITPRARDAALKTYTRIETTTDTDHRLIERADGTTVLRIGTGTTREINRRTFRTLCRSVVRSARTHKQKRIAVQFDQAVFPFLKEERASWIISTMAENFIIADYEYTAHKSKKHPSPLQEILICGVKGTSAARRALERGRIVGEAVNTCRDTANTPGGEMTPELLAAHARSASKGTGVTVTVFDAKRLAKEKMGAILAVGKGAQAEPRFIIMEYRGGAKKERSIVFVGKGITFDTGGLSIKPGDSMLDMHLDMSGGAAVISAIIAAAKIGVKKNIIALIPAAENSISDESMRPGDIITTRSGKTVDVLNTDAEGRLVLADALTYAKQYDPRLVIDVATLTGASVVALGEHASAYMTRDDALRERLMELGEESGDYLWPLPLWDEYREYTKGRFADVANIQSSGNPRAGGTINGGMFLSHFADYPDGCAWAHIDMAPRMTSIPSDKLAKGATGEPVRLLVALAESY